MTTFVEAVRSRIPGECQRKKCRGSGCELGLAGLAPERVLISMDCKALGIPPDATKCDFLFVGEGTWVVPIELKGKKMEASQVARQLQEGARLAEKAIAPLRSARPAIRFRPVAVSKGMHPSQRDALRRPENQVRFRNVLYGILPARCGDRLARVLGRPDSPAPASGRRRRNR